MKKKLISILALLASVSLVACSTAESAGKKAKKKLEEDIDKVESKVKDYIDDETDLENINGKDKNTKKTEAPETTDADPTEADPTTEGTAPANFDPDIKFTIFDLDAVEYNETVFKDHEVTMINFWEPWCGPCVAEMPELEKLYQEYKDKGLQIIGVYSASDQMADVNKAVDDAHVTYPICDYDEAFDKFQTGYVPTTIFVDRNGHIINVSNGYGDGVIVGSNDYDTWASMIDGMLG